MQRPLSTITQIPRAFCARVPHRAHLAVSGANAAQFLNGITTSTVSSTPRYTALLHAQGRIEYDIFIWPLNDQTYLMEHDPRPSEAPTLSALLKRYILRSKVKVSDVSDQYEVWQAWGAPTAEPIRQWKYGNKGAVEPVWQPDAWKGHDSMSLRDLRAVGMGSRHLVERNTRPTLTQDYDIATEDDYTAHRVTCGVPEGMVDLPPMQALAMNTNLDLMGAIDFRKGCYVGQELTVRTYHTGVVRRRIFPVTLSTDGSALHEMTQNPDIPTLNPQDISAPSSNASSSRRRGTPNRLLTNLRGLGLASLKTQQISGLLDGRITMVAVDQAGIQYQVRPQIPSWWPIQEFEASHQFI